MIISDLIYIYKAVPVYRDGFVNIVFLRNMNTRNVLLLLFIVAGVVSCNDNRNPETPAGALSSVKNGLDAESLMKKADSLQILYYDDPDGDPVRYTRYYKYTVTKDTAVNNDLLANFAQPVEQRNVIKNCRSEGKIYVFDSRQEPVKTIYFSTRCDSCCYLYYIKEGAFYYFPLTDKFKDRLQENKTRSRQP